MPLYSSPEGLLADHQEEIVAAMRHAGIDAARKGHPEDDKIPLGEPASIEDHIALIAQDDWVQVLRSRGVDITRKGHPEDQGLPG